METLESSRSIRCDSEGFEKIVGFGEVGRLDRAEDSLLGIRFTSCPRSGFGLGEEKSPLAAPSQINSLTVVES